MGKVGDGGLLSLVALAGVGLAAANGVSIEDGAKKIGDYLDEGAKAVGKMEVSEITSSISALQMGNTKDLAFIGTSEVSTESLSEQEMMEELYPDMAHELDERGPK